MSLGELTGRSTTTDTAALPGQPEWLSAAGDLMHQLAYTRQWDADGAALLRPAAFHAWGTANRNGPQ